MPIGVIHTRSQDQIQNPDGTVVVNSFNTIDTFSPASVQTTSTLASGASLDFGEQFGGRFTAGMWLVPDGSIGLESSFFFLNRESLGFNSTTGNTLNQGLVNFQGSSTVYIVTMAAGSTPSSRTVFESFPSFVIRQASTTLTGVASTETWGAELNARCTSEAVGAVSGLVGFRYLNFSENLNVNNSVQFFLPSNDPLFQDVNGLKGPLNANFPTDLRFATADTLRTHNDFYGGQVGLDLDMFLGRFIIDLRGKVALGVMHQAVDVFGASVATSVPASLLPNQGTPVPGGLLSGPLDQGTHSRNEISATLEFNVKLGYMITPSLRAYVGYDFLYLPNVLRPGDQTGISSAGVNVTVAGASNPIAVTQPSFRFKDSDVWFNGINFGMEYRY